MQLTTVPLSALLPPTSNPRHTFDKDAIVGLAQSIRNDGILENLLVRPEGDGKYRVVFGKRRYLALRLLRKQKAIAADYPVPVGVKEGLTDDDAQWFSTVENAQREALHPLDEGEDYARLLQSGGSLDVLTERTGLSTSTVKRRLVLATLAPEIKDAFRGGAFGRTIAEALSLGSHEQQKSMLESLQSDDPPDVESIREIFLSQKPTLAMAAFPRERYSGTLTTDLFADEETTYFDDVDQFFALQREAVEQMAVERRETAAFVEVLNAYTVPWWHYGEAAEGELGGVVINLHPSGAVEVREGLARHQVDAPVAEATRDTPMPPRPARKRPEFSTDLLRYAACQRSAIAQAALWSNPRKAKEVAATLLLLGFRCDFGLRLKLHACHEAARAERGQRAHQTVETSLTDLAVVIGLLAGPDGSGDGQGALDAVVDSPDASVVLEGVRRLSDEYLDQLLVLLPLLCLGQDHLETVDSGNSLLNQIMEGSDLVLRSWWLPDESFLSLLTREQLIAVAKAVGAAEQLTGLNAWAKKRLVEALTTYFAEHATSQGEDGRTAREWAPGLLRFPATKAIVEPLP